MQIVDATGVTFGASSFTYSPIHGAIPIVYAGKYPIRTRAWVRAIVDQNAADPRLTG